MLSTLLLINLKYHSSHESGDDGASRIIHFRRGGGDLSIGEGNSYCFFIYLFFVFHMEKNFSAVNIFTLKTLKTV